MGELHKAAGWRLAVAEVEKIHRNDFIDDPWPFAAGPCSLALDLPFAAIELIDHMLEDADEDDVLFARVLQLIQPKNHFAPVHPYPPRVSLFPVRSENASGCCSAQRNQRRLRALMESTKIKSYSI